MLNLHRDPGQRISIEAPGVGVIWVMVCRITGRGAIIGVEAPPGVAVDREEIRRSKAANWTPRHREPPR